MGYAGSMSNEEMVSPSELGEYVYCNRAWWLRRIAGVAPSGAAQQAMDDGEQWHKEQWHAITETRRDSSLRLWAGWGALALAAALMVLWWRVR